MFVKGTTHIEADLNQVFDPILQKPIVKTYKVEYLHTTGKMVFRTHHLLELIDKLDELESDKYVVNHSITISTIEE